MGCGKSKHDDVASGNTVLQRKKSSLSSQENGTETKDKNNNNNVDNVSSAVEVEQKESESVKEFGLEGKGGEVNEVKGEAEKTNVQANKVADADAAEGKTEVEKDDSLIEDDQKINDADTAGGAAEEKKLTENEEEDVSVKEETLAKEEEDIIEDTNVSTSEGEKEDLKAEEEQ